MRADRLVSLTLLLRQRGRMTAAELARELEVSTRTVLRDIDALSTAGVPVYADRGRHGGFSILPGFRTELTGLSHDEALALVTAGSRSSGHAFGLDLAQPLAAALRKVVDALSEQQRSHLNVAASRVLVEPATDLLSRRHDMEQLDIGVIRSVRRAVLAGRKLRFDYAAPGGERRGHLVDPLGLVAVRDRTYLLALKDGTDRTYRLSRIRSIEVLDEAAERPEQLDLEALWSARAAAFLAHERFDVRLRVATARRADVLNLAKAVHSEEHDSDGHLTMHVSFDDLRHAVWAVWQLAEDAEVLDPPDLRRALRERAMAILERYPGEPSAP